MKAKKTKPSAIRVVRLSRTVGSDDDAVEAVRDVSFSVQPGELLVLKGKSGQDTSTLLNCLAGLDEPDSGSIFIGDIELTAMREADRVSLRQTHIGVLSQSIGMIPFLTVAENVEVPMRLAGMPPGEREERVEELLELVGLTKDRQHLLAQLSGGQQQRVALARAFANRPRILIADEPYPQLDSTITSSFVDLMSNLVRSHQVAGIIATNDPLLIRRADRVLELHRGRISSSSSCANSTASAPTEKQSGMIEVSAEITARTRGIAGS